MRPKLLGNPLVAWRDENTLQIGWGSHGVVVQDAPPGLPNWLAALDGSSTLPEILDHANRLGVGRAEGQRLLQQLRKAGLLDAPQRLTVSVASSGCAPEALAEALAAAGVTVRRGAAVTVYPQGQVPSLVAAPAASRLIPVWFSACSVHVGPVIDDRVGPCARCVDLTWRDLDPCWPQLVAQATSAGVWADPAQVVQAAGAVALMGASPEAVGLEMILDQTNAGPGWRVWSVHDRCSNHAT